MNYFGLNTYLLILISFSLIVNSALPPPPETPGGFDSVSTDGTSGTSSIQSMGDQSTTANDGTVDLPEDPNDPGSSGSSTSGSSSNSMGNSGSSSSPISSSNSGSSSSSQQTTANSKSEANTQELSSSVLERSPDVQSENSKTNYFFIFISFVLGSIFTFIAIFSYNYFMKKPSKASTELKNYVNSLKQQGYPSELIKEKLLISGYNIETIQEVLV